MSKLRQRLSWNICISTWATYYLIKYATQTVYLNLRKSRGARLKQILKFYKLHIIIPRSLPTTPAFLQISATLLCLQNNLWRV